MKQPRSQGSLLHVHMGRRDNLGMRLVMKVIVNKYNFIKTVKVN